MKPISTAMAHALWRVATAKDREVLVLAMIEGLSVQLRALVKRGLVEIETISHPADWAFKGSESFDVYAFAVTEAGRKEILSWGDEPKNGRRWQ